MSSFADAVLHLKELNDRAWVLVSQLSVLPGTLILLLKLYLYSRGEDLAPTKLNRWTDVCFRWLGFYCFVYYVGDSLSILLLGRFGHICYQAYFMHHLASTLALVHVFSHHKPFLWFEVLLSVLHSCVLAFPSATWLPYVYFATFLNLTLQVFLAPYKSLAQCRSIRKYIPVALVSFGMMQYFDCLHMLDASNASRVTR